MSRAAYAARMAHNLHDRSVARVLSMNDSALAGLSQNIILDEIIPARAPWDHLVRAGETLRIIDLEGNQAVDFLLYAAADDTERYSAQDTIAAQRNIFLRAGSILRSNEGNPLARICQHCGLPRWSLQDPQEAPHDRVTA